MDSLEPVVTEDHSAVPAFGAHAVVIVRPIVRAVGEIVPIAHLVRVLECMDFSPDDGLHEGISSECGYLLYNSKFILDVNVDSEC